MQTQNKAVTGERVYYKIGCRMGHNSYVDNAEGKEYATFGACSNAIANRINEQKCRDDAFAVLKFTEHAPVLIAGNSEPDTYTSSDEHQRLNNRIGEAKATVAELLAALQRSKLVQLARKRAKGGRR